MSESTWFAAVGNRPTQGGMLAALRKLGWEVSGNGSDGAWNLVASARDGRRVYASGMATYAAAVEYLYDAIVGGS